MIKKVSIIKLCVVMMIGSITNQIYGQKKDKKMKLMTVNYEMTVDVTLKQAWEVLASYGNVGTFHSSLKSSKSINGSANNAELGCDRECIIPNGKKDIIVKEKIIDIAEGEYYTYNIYDWENFPIKKMFITYGVKTNSLGETIIYQNSEYRLKPRFLTWPMKGKMRKGAREALMSYKHYMETGHQKVDIKLLKQKYKDS